MHREGLTSNDIVTIQIRGFCSKKNRKAPNANGRGLHMEKDTRLMIERMELQIPGHVRDLKLDNPEAEWFVTYTNAHIDVDGIISTVLDILQKYGVIVNDNIAHFGNRQTIHPAVRGEFDIVTVVLIPKGVATDSVSPQQVAEEDGPPQRRYIIPRRPRISHPAPTTTDDLFAHYKELPADPYEE